MSWVFQINDQRAEPGTGCTPAELNHILHAHFVGHHLWNGSLSCSGVLRVPDGIPSICQRSTPIPSTQYSHFDMTYKLVHSTLSANI
jgi:hypothetical protein